MANPGRADRGGRPPASSSRPRRRTGGRSTGPELRPTMRRSRTPSGGDVPGDTWAYREAPPGGVPGCSRGMANGNSTSAYPSSYSGRALPASSCSTSWYRYDGILLGEPVPPVPGAPRTPAAYRSRTPTRREGTTGRTTSRAPGAPGPGHRSPVLVPRGRSPGSSTSGDRSRGRWGHVPVPPPAPGHRPVRASPRAVPRPGTSLAGTARWSLKGICSPGSSPGSSTSGTEAGASGMPGCLPLPRLLPGIVRYVRRVGREEPPWLPRGARSTNGVGRRNPQCPTGPRLEESPGLSVSSYEKRLPLSRYR